METVNRIVTKQTTVRGIAREILKLYRDPSRWCKYDLFSPAGDACCVLGAGVAVAKDINVRARFYRKFKVHCSPLSIAGFNDVEGYDEVIKVLRKMAR